LIKIKRCKICGRFISKLFTLLVCRKCQRGKRIKTYYTSKINTTNCKLVKNRWKGSIKVSSSKIRHCLVSHIPHIYNFLFDNDEYNGVKKNE